MLPLCSRSSLAPAAARAAYLPFGVPPSPSLPQDEPPTARGRSVAPAGAAGHTAPTGAATGHAGRSLCGWRRRPFPGSDAVPAWAPNPQHRAGAVPAAPAVPNPSEPAFSFVMHFNPLCPVAQWALLPPPRGARRARSPKPAPPRFCYGPGCKPTTRRPPTRCTRDSLPSADHALSMRPRRGHYPTGVQRGAARHH